VTTRWRGWCANAMLAVVAVIVALGAVEIGLRLLAPQPLGVWHQDRDGLALHWPGLVTYLPQLGQVVSINSVGLRDREHAVPKPAGAYRILLLGDSFMEALQLPFDASFPRILEAELGRRTNRPVEVVNASVSGWGTDDELRYLETYGARWEPDLVLVAMTLHNDVNDNLRERFHRNDSGTLAHGWQRRLSALEFGLIEVKGFLASRSHAYQLFLRARRSSERKAEAAQLNTHVEDLLGPTPSPRLAKGIELTRLLLARMRLVAAQQQAQVVVVLLPLAVQVPGRARPGLVQNVGTTAPGDMDRPQQRVGGIARRAGVEVIDLLPPFRAWAAAGGPDLYLEHDGHWNASGHGVAARVVASELDRHGIARR